jgi:hypothetical protein
MNREEMLRHQFLVDEAALTPSIRGGTSTSLLSGCTRHGYGRLLEALAAVVDAFTMQALSGKVVPSTRNLESIRYRFGAS